jgi:single-strand DNA-binding protein
MNGLNRVQLLGNLGRDPEIRSTTSGDRIANLNLATNESWKDKTTGEKKERVEWHRIVIFNSGLVGVVEQYARKGARLFIEGKLRTRKWTDNAGADRYATEIVLSGFDGQLILLDGAGDGNRPPAASPEDYGDGPGYGASPGYGARHDNPAAAARVAAGGGRGGRDDLDDEIPF